MGSLFFFLKRQKTRLNNINDGNIMAIRIPIWKLSPNKEEKDPTTLGPKEHPTSPAKANIAKRSVPPFLIVLEAFEKVPGQRIPTENPTIAQATSPIAGISTKEITK